MNRNKKILLSGIEDSLKNILKVDSSNLVNCRVTNYHKLMFHSGKRPGAAIALTYRDSNNKIHSDHIWAKRIKDPELAFRKMSGVYRRLASSTLNSKMPIPRYFDRKTSIIYTSRVFGNSLAIVTLKNLGLIPIRMPKWLCELYFDIGAWLNKYNLVMSNYQKFGLKKIIKELFATLNGFNYFTTNEKKTILRHLVQIENKINGNLYLESTVPHNDFSLRNIIIRKNRQFTIIDWDAMIHGDFPKLAPIWHDLTTFLLSIQSLIRFHPLVSSTKIGTIITSFLEGYFNKAETSIKDQIEDMFYIFTLRAFTGISSDRPLFQIYRKRLSHRFIKKLKTKLLDDKPFLTKISFP